MTDIVERLRRERETDHLAIEAADEIERLRAALSKARWHLNRYNQPEALAVIGAALEPKP